MHHILVNGLFHVTKVFERLDLTFSFEHEETYL